MPTGLLSHLPLHAAGRHRTGDGDTVLDRVISSYTPTAWLLDRAAGSTGRVGTAPLVVTAPTVPGAPRLPGVADEVRAVRDRFPSAVTCTDATRADVLAGLRDHDWVHLACHAAGDELSPSAARLMLTDGPLSLHEIGRVRRRDAYLAYQSACETARSGTAMADQAVHVSSAFQLAGFRHVVATLWPVGDRAAVDFAEAFYSALDPADPAAGVHAATRKLRDRHGGASVLDWAGHLHVGA